jgi:hypothetical protein
MAARGRKNVDDLLLIAWAGGATIRQAAERAGVSERTAARRLAEADFRRRAAQLRADLVDRALGKLTDGLTAAADTLRALLTAQAETVRLGAARSLIELAARLRETTALADKLALLESTLEGLKHAQSQQSRQD